MNDSPDPQRPRPRVWTLALTLIALALLGAFLLLGSFAQASSTITTGIDPTVRITPLGYGKQV